ncbi:MAG: hypothetical protein FWD66_02640 [Paludibacter sp.]|nr:hypothetical protein [Paludibacter sp.]
MKIKMLVIICLLFAAVSVCAQNLSDDYKIISVNKKVAEIEYNQPYNSPLENYIARIHLWINGEYAPIYSEIIDYGVSKQREPYDKAVSDHYLKSEIEEVVIYKDSVGLVFLKENPDADDYLVGISQYENGKWLGRGDGICFTDNMNDATQYIEENSVGHLRGLREYYRQQIVSTDTLAFVNYLKESGKDPKQYLLEKLTDYPLVIYGELHRRQLSWNFLKSVANDPKFTEICSTVFMELPYYNQPLFDKFLNNNTLDTTLIFSVLETEQQYGWQDKGEYEFIKEIWKINNNSKNKLRIIPVDYQANWDNIKTSDDWKNYLATRKDRDSTMARIILKNIDFNDTRHCLFVVGMMHAKKSTPNRWGISAGTILNENLPKNTLFSIMPHGMISDNIGWLGQYRYGFFDYIFENQGNKPVAFDLKNSPFGKEPFDAEQVIRFSPNCGNYEDYYDGYIFLCPVKEEPYEYELTELFTAKFVEELKRRAVISGDKEGYYDIPLTELSKEKIIEKIKSDKEKSGDRRYFEYFNKE